MKANKRTVIDNAIAPDFKPGQVWKTRDTGELVLILRVDLRRKGEVTPVVGYVFPNAPRATPVLHSYRRDGGACATDNTRFDLAECVGYIERPGFVPYDMNYAERLNSYTQMLSAFHKTEVQSDLVGSSTQTQSDSRQAEVQSERARLAQAILAQMVRGVTSTVLHTYAKDHATAAVKLADALLVELAKDQA
ncbi:hypothetical protein D3C86_1180200 [compost metagenome]